MASHAERAGHPASAQSRNSAARQWTDRPIRTGRGTLPPASQLLQVLNDRPTRSAASFAVSSSRSVVVALLVRLFIGPLPSDACLIVS
jgi:hypothetical protein